MEVISRKEAIEQGLRFYFTGKPCKHGHVGGRYVRSGACVACARLTRAAAVASGKNAEANRRYRAARKDCPEFKGKKRESDRRYAAENPHVKAVNHVTTKLTSLGRDPAAQIPTLTRSEQDAMRRVYRERDRLNAFEASLPEAARITARWEVDHVLRLSRGGLHHPSNVQIVTSGVNGAKKDDRIEREHLSIGYVFGFLERCGALTEFIESGGGIPAPAAARA